MALTQKDAREHLARLGMVLRKKDGELLVGFKGEGDEHAALVETPLEALIAGQMMHRDRFKLYASEIKSRAQEGRSVSLLCISDMMDRQRFEVEMIEGGLRLRFPCSNLSEGVTTFGAVWNREYTAAKAREARKL